MQSNCSFLDFMRKVLWLFPSEIRVVFPKMSVCSSLLIDGPFELQIPDNAPRPQIEILKDDVHQIGVLVSRSGSPIGIHMD